MREKTNAAYGEIKFFFSVKEGWPGQQKFGKLCLGYPGHIYACRLHLLLFGRGLLWGLTITERNKQKGRIIFDPALPYW